MAAVTPVPSVPLAMDTDVFSDLTRGVAATRDFIQQHLANTGNFPSITSITIFERLIGIEAELRKRKITTEQAEQFRGGILQIAATYRILDFNAEAASIVAQIMVSLGENKSNKLWYDIMIVATAMAHKHGVATRNKKHMELIADNLPPEYDPLPLAIWKR
ncbi:MAG TPA: type II toxin-antitoxin system VapC family toxin [Pyrinomonadaceae bacterium]|nr:type II toxin-antitoxin system VapC family toxin [Pyrinomonadaceae bacterium]